MWEPEHKAQFLATAYQEIHATNRALRERLHIIVNYSVTLFVVVAGFFVTQSTSALSVEMRFFFAIGIILMIILSIFLLQRTFENLMKQNNILASLEEAMCFHEASHYLPSSKTLFDSATSEKLRDPSYYHRTMDIYRLVVVVVGGFSFFSILVSAAAK